MAKGPRKKDHLGHATCSSKHSLYKFLKNVTALKVPDGIARGPLQGRYPVMTVSLKAIARASSGAFQGLLVLAIGLQRWQNIQHVPATVGHFDPDRCHQNPSRRWSRKLGFEESFLNNGAHIVSKFV